MTITLQQCRGCGTVNYPSRQACHHCLSQELVLEQVSGSGQLRAICTVHRTLEPAFEPLLPISVGTVVLDCGPQMIAFVTGAARGERVQVSALTSPLGGPAWEARPIGAETGLKPLIDQGGQ